jgi:uncharacterized damage-inducible protein DinB
MKNEIRSIISDYHNSLQGEPWFGRSIIEILQEVAPEKAFIKPNDSNHSMVDLLYHMITWAEFTLKRIEKDTVNDMAAFEKLDWREIDPLIHGWEEGVAYFVDIHKKIIALLESKEDQFLDEKVDYRKYNFRFLLKGMMEHNIYHLGQIAYLRKLLE